MRETVARGSQHQTKHLRVLLVDDQVLFTEALTGVLIDKNIGVVVVSCIEDLFAKLSVDEHAFDLVVVDMSMSSTQALALLACIKATHPTVRTALLTGEVRTEVVREAIRSGAIGVITRESSISTLITALRFMAEGEEFVPASVLLPSGTRLDDPLDLTAEEQGILEEMAGGSSNRDIANVLRIPEAEIKSKIKSIFRKLGVNSRTRAAVEARAKGYL